MTKRETKNNSQVKGGGLFSSGSKHSREYELFSKAKTSEKELFKILKEYNKTTEKYYRKYQHHVENLIHLDEAFPDVDSFRKSFELIFNTEDKNNLKNQALLLQNYVDLEPFYEPDDMIKYHLIQQISYLLVKAYTDQERLLISQISIQNVITKPEMVIVTVDGRNTGFFPIPHQKYNLDYTKMKLILDQAIDQMRETLKKESKPSSMFPTPDVNPGALVGLKPLQPMVALNPIVINSKKTDSKKTGSKKSNKLENIKIPTDQPVLPVFKIDVPRKASPPNKSKPKSKKSYKKAPQKKYSKNNNKYSKRNNQKPKK